MRHPDYSGYVLPASCQKQEQTWIAVYLLLIVSFVRHFCLCFMIEQENAFQGVYSFIQGKKLQWELNLTDKKNDEYQ